MKKEPLKNKKDMVKNVFDFNDIKSAVEYLKKRFRDERIGETTYNFLVRLVDESFEDIKINNGGKNAK